MPGYFRVVLLAVLAWLIAFTQKNKLPAKDQIASALLEEPAQTQSFDGPFTIVRNGENYRLTPVAQYDLSGLVVSLHHSNSWLDISHKDWKDYLNVADLCVVFGDNISNGSYRKVSYSHGDWTCYYEYSGSEGAAFKNHFFSNNHILVNDSALEKKILAVEEGDQVRFKGFLVNYENTGVSVARHTSVTRDDMGNGACEIVYVKDFEIVSRANPFWRAVSDFSKYALAACLLYGFYVITF